MKIMVENFKIGEDPKDPKIRFVIADLKITQLIDLCTYIDYRRKDDPEGIWKDTYKKKAT